VLLDYNPSNSYFVLRVGRDEGIEPDMIRREHGLDFSIPASTSQFAVLMTKEPFAAAAFGDYATPAARAQLHGILTEIETSRAPDSDAHIRCPADQELWGFQKADIAYALRRTNTLIGDQPGLGKTPIAICFANEVRAKRVLVVCPASIRLQWMRKIRIWTCQPWPYTIYPIINSKCGVHPKAEWTVVSYDLLRSEPIMAALLKGLYDVLILDEAHYLKEATSRRTQALFGGGRNQVLAPLFGRCGATLALTGTPLPNRPREAFTLAKNLCHDSIDFMGEEAFQERFNPTQRIETIDKKTGRTKFFIDERSGRHAELQNRLRANFMTRHLKREVMTQLKMPEYDIVQLDSMTPAIKEALKAESLLEIDPEHLEGADAEILGDVSTVRKQMGIAMAPAVADYVDTLIEGGEEKLVIFAWHIEVLNILEKRFAEYGVVRVDGKTGSVRKEARVKKFIEDPTVRIILGNILSMGVGTDGLQEVCNHAIIAEPDWVPGNNIQCFDRLDRGGQNSAVQGDICVVPGSFAERVLATALRKNQTNHKALDRRM
jgi:SWI/SNF-related matrix-associated actin-dependent regulator 1 of chromatin subfamily A